MPIINENEADFESKSDSKIDDEILDLDSESDLPDKQLLDTGRLIHTVLSQFLEYHDSEGSSLNICEVLLLLKDSIDQNTKMQKTMFEKLISK